jgi:hypothetical protein
MDAGISGFGCEMVSLVQVRVHWWSSVNWVIVLWVPWKAGNLYTGWKSTDFSKK